VIDDGRPGQCWLPKPGETQLLSDDVHVWCVAVKPLIGHVPQLAKFLSNDERSRANAFIHAMDRERFIISHGILRVLIGCYLKVAPAETMRWEIVELKISEEYAAALAVEGHNWRLTIRTTQQR
jgi:hypothetical protein